MDKERFCSLVREHEKSMYAFAMSILKNSDDVADCLQEAILKAYTKLDSLKAEGKFKSWVMTIVHNCAIEIIRTKQNVIDISECEDMSSNDADVSKKITVRDALDKLENPYRCVIFLFYYEQMPIKQIAKTTGTTEENVRTRLVRGRKMLAKTLDKESLM